MFEGPLQDVIDEFSRLPGIGPKSAQKIALHLLKVDSEEIEHFTAALNAMREGVAFCRICGNISQHEVCQICNDPARDASTVCVVEGSKDIPVIERTGEYRGRYHVLGGSLDPMNGIGPNELNVVTLLQRVAGTLPDRANISTSGFHDTPEISEIIIATDPDAEGEATSAYLGKILKDFPGLSVSRLASGMPMGGTLEFVDELTLSRAFSGRIQLN